MYRLQKPRTNHTYDVIAIKPKTEKAFTAACESIEAIDIIVVDMSDKVLFRHKRGSIKSAVQQNLHFEVHYSSALCDSASRRNLITNTQELVRMCKGRNIVLSGNCDQVIGMRSPSDVTHIGTMFGLSLQAARAITTNSYAVHEHGRTRKMTGSALSLSRMSELSPGSLAVLNARRRYAQVSCTEDEGGSDQRTEDTHLSLSDTGSAIECRVPATQNGQNT